jgi:hypothetical protein
VVSFSVGQDGRLGGPTEIGGLNGLSGPVDLAEDPSTGNVYVSELDAARLTLFRPRGRVSVTNLDPAPYTDRVAFNRIATPADASQRFHETATIRVSNTGGIETRITGLPVTGPFEVISPPSLPFSLAPGTSTNIDVRFNATTGTVATGSLSVQTDAGNRTVALAGYGQTLSENGQEPSVPQMLQVFGYRTQLPADMNNHGAYVAQADEVLAPYWSRLDAGRPVRLTQLAAYHTQGSTGSAYWHPRDSSEATLIGTHSGVWAQSVLPRQDGENAPVTRTFTPTAAAFGFRVDGEWSDPTRNDSAVDRANGCTAEQCGSHVRFFRVRDRAGALVAGSYLLVMDYSGFNYDFNDNVYLLENVTPAT